MKLDDIMPVYDFTEVHSIRVRASPETAYRAVRETTLAEISWVVRFLFFLRSLPEKLVGRHWGGLSPYEPMLDEMIKGGFVSLAEEVPREFVLGTIVPGQIGRVWKKSSTLEFTIKDAQRFLLFSDPSCLKVVANLCLEESGSPGQLVVRTESRTGALSHQALKNFRLYWRIIRPFSGLIRRMWLQAIKNRAERAQAT